jgi:hypothetical protein
MDVYLVRHAIAGQRDPARWPDDSQRPLTTYYSARRDRSESDRYDYNTVVRLGRQTPRGQDERRETEPSGEGRAGEGSP